MRGVLGQILGEVFAGGLLVVGGVAYEGVAYGG